MALLSFFSVILSAIISRGCYAETYRFVIRVDTHGPLMMNLFVSNTIDSSIISNWPSQYFESVRVNTLAKGLTGSFIRFGGTLSDQIIYNTNGSISNGSFYDILKQPQWYTLNLTQLSQISNFAQRNNWQLIFGLNAQYRYPNNTWNPTNTEQLLDAIIATKNDQLMYAFELGNEPDLYYNVSSIQMANDYNTIYNLLRTTFQSHQMLVPKVFGPDIANNISWLQSFLIESKRMNTLNGITFHHYYGSNTKLNSIYSFIDVNILDELYDYLGNITHIIWKYYNKEIAIIIGETSSTFGGGTTNLSTSYVSGFMMLDKLGLSSIYGIFSVMRQTFCGYNYGLIGNGSYNEFLPNPNYWNQYLFKNLVGNKALYVDGEMEYGRYIRIYSFCTRINDGFAAYNYPIGSVTVLILNLYNKSVSIDLQLNGTSNIIPPSSYYDEYLLTSYPNIVNSRDIFLNGKIIKMPNENTLPTLNGSRKAFGSMTNMEPLSYGFVVMVNANVTVCTY